MMASIVRQIYHRLSHGCSITADERRVMQYLLEAKDDDVDHADCIFTMAMAVAPHDADTPEVAQEEKRRQSPSVTTVCFSHY